MLTPLLLGENLRVERGSCGRCVSHFLRNHETAKVAAPFDFPTSSGWHFSCSQLWPPRDVVAF